jgi:hypothetical protein
MPCRGGVAAVAAVLVRMLRATTPGQRFFEGAAPTPPACSSRGDALLKEAMAAAAAVTALPAWAGCCSSLALTLATTRWCDAPRSLVQEVSE